MEHSEELARQEGNGVLFRLHSFLSHPQQTTEYLARKKYKNKYTLLPKRPALEHSLVSQVTPLWKGMACDTKIVPTLLMSLVQKRYCGFRGEGRRLALTSWYRCTAQATREGTKLSSSLGSLLSVKALLTCTEYTPSREAVEGSGMCSILQWYIGDNIRANGIPVCVYFTMLT